MHFRVTIRSDECGRPLERLAEFSDHLKLAAYLEGLSTALYLVVPVGTALDGIETELYYLVRQICAYGTARFDGLAGQEMRIQRGSRFEIRLQWSPEPF